MICEQIFVAFSLSDGKQSSEVSFLCVMPEDIKTYEGENQGEIFPMESFIANYVHQQLHEPASSSVTITRIAKVKTEIDTETGHVEIVEWLNEIYPSKNVSDKRGADHALHDFLFEK